MIKMNQKRNKLLILQKLSMIIINKNSNQTKILNKNNKEKNIILRTKSNRNNYKIQIFLNNNISKLHKI